MALQITEENYDDVLSSDKPILLDYWVSSLEAKALIGVRENQEKLLVKE